MERTSSAAVLPIDVGWSDVGSWSSLWELSTRDEQGNAVHGDAVLQATEDSYIHSERRLVATIGVKDLVIVDTPDALLVADRGKTQDVANIVAKLKAAGRKEHESQLRNYRPWGFFETLNVGPRFQVKLLHVKPGGKLSMQMHHHRSEHWVVVRGTARVTIGDEEKLVQENQSVYIVATPVAPAGEPGQDSAGDHRGPARQLSGRGRHRACRRCLQSRARRDEMSWGSVSASSRWPAHPLAFAPREGSTASPPAVCCGAGS